jgi:hypothetical protein
MPNISLTFIMPINTSVQIGDTAYYCDNTLEEGGFTTATQSSIQEIGPISNITSFVGPLGTTQYVIVCSPDIASETNIPAANDFIMFSKDNAVNISSPTGYYAQAKFVNKSIEKSEMFATACDVFESSK